MAEMDIMLKLFDTLKQSSDKNEATIQKLIEQQHTLIGHIEYLPIKELQDSLKDHNKETSDDINSCTETVETTSDVILTKVNSIDTKIGKMILIVIVAFTLFSMSVLIATLTQTKNIPTYSDLKSVITDQNELIEELKKDIDEYHRQKIK